MKQKEEMSSDAVSTQLMKRLYDAEELDAMLRAVVRYEIKLRTLCVRTAQRQRALRVVASATLPP